MTRAAWESPPDSAFSGPALMEESSLIPAPQGNDPLVARRLPALIDGYCQMALPIRSFVRASWRRGNCSSLCRSVIFQHIFFISKLIGVDGASRIGLKRFRVIWQDAQDHVTEVYVLARIAFAGAGIVTAETIGPNILNVCLQRRVCRRKTDRR